MNGLLEGSRVIANGTWIIRVMRNVAGVWSAARSGGWENYGRVRNTPGTRFWWLPGGVRDRGHVGYLDAMNAL